MVARRPAAAALQGSPTWSPRGRSGPRTSTGCSTRCCTASCATTRCPPELLTGPLAETGLPVAGLGRLPPPEDRVFADVWSALGGELKPSLDLVVIAPVDTGRRVPGRPAGRAAAASPRRRDGRARPGRRAPPRRSRRTADDRARTASDRRPAAGDGSPDARDRRAWRTCSAGFGWSRSGSGARSRTAGATTPSPDDPFRGLYLSDEARRPAARAGRATARRPTRTTRRRAASSAPPTTAEADGADVRLRELARDFGLDRLDVELLLVALAPDVDARFEQLYGYLNDDVTRRRPSVGARARAVRRAAGRGRRAGPARADGPLVAGGLLVVEEPTGRCSRGRCGCPTGSSATCSATTTRDPALRRRARRRRRRRACGSTRPRWPRRWRGGVAADLPAGAAGSGGTALASPPRRCGAPAGARSCSTCAGSRTGPTPSSRRRLARARGPADRRGVLVGGPRRGAGRRSRRVLRALPAARVAALRARRPRAWDPPWSPRPPLQLDAPVLAPTRAPPGAPGWAPRSRRATAATARARPRRRDRPVPARPEQVVRAARRSAALQPPSAARRRPSTDLRTGVRAQNGVGARAPARRIEPAVGWRDLVLPPATARRSCARSRCAPGTASRCSTTGGCGPAAGAGAA